MYSLVVCCAIVAAISAEPFSYEGYKVLQLNVTNKEQVEALVKFDKNGKIDFWSPLRLDGKPIDVMVEPETQKEFELFLNTIGVKYTIHINNVQEFVKLEQSINAASPRERNGRISFWRYYRHPQINAYLDQLATSHPNIVTLETIGKSYENRDMKIIKISTNPSANKPVIFIDAGIHAREWIAPAQALYVINQLVENPSNRHMLAKVDWHILPVVNPDGYEYTHTTLQRFWRKTRSKGQACYGADANRNFGFHWGEVGASANECDETYKGSQPFSEVEAQAVRNYVLQYKDSLKLYLTLHSFGNLLLFPWGYTSDLPNDYAELQALGEKVAETIKQVRGTQYTVGTSTNVLYAAAGGSDDWVKAVGGVELSYTIELPRGGLVGFDPPPWRILEIVSETWVGFKTFHQYIETKFG